MEQANHQAVRVIGKVIHQDITLDDGAVHLSLDEETAHKCTSDLIIAHGIHAFHDDVFIASAVIVQYRAERYF